MQWRTGIPNRCRGCVPKAKPGRTQLVVYNNAYNTNAYTSNLANLSSYQARQLRKALIENARNKISLLDLSRDLKVPRRQIIQYFKYFRRVDEGQKQQILEADRQFEKADAERTQIIEARRAEKEEQKARHAERTERHFQSLIPYERRQKNKPALIPKGVEMQLNHIFDKVDTPSEQLIRSIQRLHKIPRTSILQWFSKRRLDTRRITKKKAQIKLEKQLEQEKQRRNEEIAMRKRIRDEKTPSANLQVQQVSGIQQMKGNLSPVQRDKEVGSGKGEQPRFEKGKGKQAKQLRGKQQRQQQQQDLSDKPIGLGYDDEWSKF